MTHPACQYVWGSPRSGYDCTGAPRPASGAVPRGTARLSPPAVLLAPGHRMVIVTVDPLGAVRPPATDCFLTVSPNRPSSPRFSSTSKPAPSSVLCASSTLSPTTSGTSTISGPLD